MRIFVLSRTIKNRSVSNIPATGLFYFMAKKLEYARKMTDAEWLGIVQYHQSRYNAQKQSNDIHINANYKTLLNAYDLKEEQYLSINANSIKQKKIYQLAKDADVCICGSKLRWNDAYRFWGCVDYKNDRVDHKNFKGKDVFVWEQPVLKHYITDIIRELGLKGKVNAKQLLEFYIKEGRVDLLEKYNLGSSWNQIDRYQNIKRIADDFEKRTESHLKTIFSIVQPQFKVIYKYEGEKEKHCILDFLCSDNNGVFIYECKTSNWDKNDSQKQLYMDVIQKIIDTLKIDKQLYFRYAVQNEK